MNRQDELAAVLGSVSRETMRRLERLEALVCRWNQRINLIGPATAPEVWRRHIVDSIQLFPLAPQARRWVDLGSGGGFPGLVLAVLQKEFKSGHIHLVESNAKKAAFLASAVAEMELPATVHRCRIEDAFDRTGTSEIVTARAVAPLHRLLGLASPWLAGGFALFPKGRDFRGEIARARDEWQFDLIEHRSTVDPEGMILEIRNLKAATTLQMERT